jgi:CIDE-N domain
MFVLFIVVTVFGVFHVCCVVQSKFSVSSEARFVFESDGCFIDDDEVLDSAIQNGDLLMVLTENQNWAAPSSGSETAVSLVNELILS